MSEDEKLISIENTYKYLRNVIQEAKNQAYKSVNVIMTQAYWIVGQKIVEEEQKGEERAEYGKYVIKYLSKRFTEDFGKGFSETNLRYMRTFYNVFSDNQALSDRLSWSHYMILSKIKKEEVREFYIKESIASGWGVRELERQVASLLYERLALSREKEEVLQLSKKGHELTKPSDMIKDPLILEFLGLKHSSKYFEKDLEQSLIEHLKEFLLELGKGFSFVSRQQRITLGGDHFYVDLVFYNRIMKCFLLIDLKVGKLTHQDIGQMQMYVNYYKRTQMLEGENKPIGILLCSEKNDVVVKFTLPEGEENIFASKYKLYFPTEEELKEEIVRERRYLEGSGESEDK